MKKSELKQIIKEIVTSLNEKKETGLYVTGKTQSDNNKIQKVIDKSDFYGEWNAREGYWFFPEEEYAYDDLEKELDKLFGKYNINARFEGI